MLKTLLSYDFRHTALNQLWRLISGPVLLVLVPIYLSPEEQGYWFTFISLAALAVFADMGFSTILLQFSAHEYAHLKFNSDGSLEGNAYYLQRIASLWRFSIKWSTAMAVFVFPFVLIAGYVILEGKEDNVNWKVAWILYGAASVVVFLNSIVLSFIEGCDRVGSVQKIRFIISVIIACITVSLLLIGEKLYALSVGLIFGALVGQLIIAIKYRNLIRQLFNIKTDVSHSWFSEIMPLMWRYAISWVSGYFIFSILSPITFHYYGAVEAGQVGLSMAVFSAIFSVSNVWMMIITPKINMYIAHSDYKQLNAIYIRHLIMSIFTYVVGVTTLFSVLWMTEDTSYDLSKRLVSMNSLLWISFAWLVQVLINALAIYMRGHKKEPLVWASLANGVFIGVVTWIIALNLSFEYVLMGFVSSYFWVLPVVLIIFVRFKRTVSYASK
ncbi:hypothetical protein [Thiomicrospira sp. S5]|uniref:hypothetical protein n=1 Tax=Thiomicrospira sp. S5 TaxID=1803865 RepID=UPI000F89F499|nr:hypothetical protein [Thiomicrospira sp. S5]AZR81691.1 flippase [Thiomicrospira sp. S5]